MVVALVGRAAEQETVGRLLASARLGRGGALVVAGDPGVGKTSLLTDTLEVPAARDAVRVLSVTPAEVEQDLPFAALHALLLPALPLLDDIPAPQAAELGAALSVRRGGGRDRFAIGAATLSLLSRYAEDGPVVVVLDDVQWADRPSVDALAFAARRVRDDPVAVLVAGRSGELPEPVHGLPVLELAGLTPDAAAELLAATYPDGAARRLDALYRETRGNPLALLELAGEPEDGSAVGDAVAELPHTLPARVQGAFARRLDALTAPERAVTLVAARVRRRSPPDSTATRVTARSGAVRASSRRAKARWTRAGSVCGSPRTASPTAAPSSGSPASSSRASGFPRVSR